MKRNILLALLALALVATTAFAGSYESNFNQIVLTEVGGEEAYVLFEASDQTDIAKIAASDADANAECLIFDLPTGGATIVPVVLLTLADADFGYFDGLLSQLSQLKMQMVTVGFQLDSLLMIPRKLLLVDRLLR